MRCEARYIGLFAGRRFGKTLGCLVPRALKLCAERPGFQIAYVAPTYKLGRKVFDLLRTIARPMIRHSRQQPTPKIEFHNGSQLDFFSWDKPKGIRGWGYNEVQFDEIQECRDEEEFWGIIRPLISDRQGTLIVAGQFRGENWYWAEFHEKAKDGKHAQHATFRFTSFDSPWAKSAGGAADLAEAEAQLPRAIWEQEYLCIPTANQAAVFRREDLDGCATGEVLARPEQGRAYIIGYDLGEHVDHSAAVVLEHGTNRVVHAEIVPLGMRHRDQAALLKQLALRWGAQVVIDATAGAAGGRHMADENVRFYRLAIPGVRAMVLSAGVKRELIRELSLEIESRKLKIPTALKALHAQLRDYEFRYRNGAYTYSAPAGKRDDLVAALALAVHASRAGWATGGFPAAALPG